MVVALPEANWSPGSVKGPEGSPEELGVKESERVAVSVAGAGAVRLMVSPAPVEMDETCALFGVICTGGAAGGTMTSWYVRMAVCLGLELSTTVIAT